MFAAKAGAGGVGDCGVVTGWWCRWLRCCFVRVLRLVLPIAGGRPGVLLCVFGVNLVLTWVLGLLWVLWYCFRMAWVSGWELFLGWAGWVWFSGGATAFWAYALGLGVVGGLRVLLRIRGCLGFRAWCGVGII